MIKAFLRNFLVKTFVIILLMMVCMTTSLMAKQKRGNEPVIVETPWGQKVVPDLPTYIRMSIYSRLLPGQSWKQGESISKEIGEKYKKEELKLRVHPWRVIDGVYVLGQDDKAQLIYLLDTGEGLLLIDPSYDSWHELIVSQIRELGYNPSQVKWVLITHCHVDHAQSCLIWRKRGAQIIAPKEDAHPIETGNQVTAWWLMKGPERYFKGCPVDRLVHDGDRLDFGLMSLYAIWTPGHTPGSTCYYLHHRGKHILFSEDIALHNGRHAWMRHPYADWEQYLKSINKLVNYTLSGVPVPYDILLPGHGVVDLEGGMRSVKETAKVVLQIVQRRRSGEDVSGLEPFRWNWEQGN